jgi:hypothetical protein
MRHLARARTACPSAETMAAVPQHRGGFSSVAIPVVDRVVFDRD